LWAGQASSSNAGSGQLWSMIITACMVSIIPLVISFLTLQRYWQNGLTIGSLK
jgi:multiple sugar transport system permease protein